MVDHIHQHGEILKPIDVRTSVERRRRWLDDLKRRIFAASFAPRAIVADLAREYELAQPIYTKVDGRLELESWWWPRTLTSVLRGGCNYPRPGISRSFVEIEVAGAVVRVETGSDLGRVAQIIHALKATM